MNIRDLRELAGFSRPAFHQKYGVPVRTQEDWDSGYRNTPKLKEIALTKQVMDDIKNGEIDMNGELKRAEIWMHVFVELYEAKRLVGGKAEKEYALKIRSFARQPFTHYEIFTKKLMQFSVDPRFSKIEEHLRRAAEYLNMFPTLEEARKDTPLDAIWAIYHSRFQDRQVIAQ